MRDLMLFCWEGERDKNGRREHHPAGQSLDGRMSGGMRK